MRRQMGIASTLLRVSVAIGILVGVGAGPARASFIDTRLDFDDLVHGEVVTDQYADFPGVSLRGENFARSFDYVIAFDSLSRGTDDTDLEASDSGLRWSGGNIANEDLGRFLILQENDSGCGDGICDDPDDERFRPAGEIYFAFAFPVLSFGFDLIDVESESMENGMVSFFLEGTRVGMIEFKDLLDPNSPLFDDTIEFGDHSANRVQPITADFLGVAEFDAAVLKLGGSGAVDNILFDSTRPIPEPAAGSLLGLGLVGLAARQRLRLRKH